MGLTTVLSRVCHGLEICSECVYDLLEVSPHECQKRRALPLKEDKSVNAYIKCKKFKLSSCDLAVMMSCSEDHEVKAIFVPDWAARHGIQHGTPPAPCTMSKIAETSGKLDTIE